VTVVVGLGALAVLPGTAATSAAAATGVTKVVVLTNSSNGTTTLVTKGEEVVVRLTSDGHNWTEASVVNASAVVVLRFVSGHVAPDGSSVTTFLVVGYGSAALRAVGNPKCLQRGCAIPSVLWTANVVSPVIDPLPPTAT
jgi:hypothetical protein